MKSLLLTSLAAFLLVSPSIYAQAAPRRDAAAAGSAEAIQRSQDYLDMLGRGRMDGKKVDLVAAAKVKVEVIKKEIVELENRIRKSKLTLDSFPKGMEGDRQKLENSLTKDKSLLAKHEKKLAEQKTELAELEKAAMTSAFVGRWRIVDDKGVTACFFTLTSSFEAKKSHAPDVTAKWEMVGNEARITWSDGWKDILRPEKDRVLKIAFGPGATWDDKPTNSHQGIKEKAK